MTFYPLLPVLSTPFADDSTLHHSIKFQRRPTQEELMLSREAASALLSSDLASISEWGRENLVNFNASKTQFLHITNRRNSPNSYPITFNSCQLQPSQTINILGVTFSSDLTWKDHITNLAKLGSRRLGALRRLSGFFNPSQLLSVYRGLVRPCVEYNSHIWGGSTHSVLLDRLESKAIRLIASPSLTTSLTPLCIRRSVASLSLFYRYYHNQCSSELSNCVPPPLRRSRNTRFSSQSHTFSVQLSNPRLNRFSQSFFYFSAINWNSLPQHVFPSTYDLPTFKRRVAEHLSHHWNWTRGNIGPMPPYPS